MSTVTATAIDQMIALTIEKHRLRSQLQSLVWAAHLPLTSEEYESSNPTDLRVLQNEIEAAEALLEESK